MRPAVRWTILVVFLVIAGAAGAAVCPETWGSWPVLVLAGYLLRGVPGEPQA